MIARLKDALSPRNALSGDVVEDAFGVAALFLLLFVALAVPAVV